MLGEKCGEVKQEVTKLIRFSLKIVFVAIDFKNCLSLDSPKLLGLSVSFGIKIQHYSSDLKGVRYINVAPNGGFSVTCIDPKIVGLNLA